MKAAGQPSGRLQQLLLALAVALILADSSVVTLALPAILRDLDASVDGVAWVLISFNLALALAALPAAALARGRDVPAFVVAMALFAAASLACALAPSLGVLIAARAAQGLLGAVAIAAALDLLLRAAGRERALRLWAGSGVLGAALGPAVGGFLTEWFSWEAMFALQVPLALLVLAGARGLGSPAAVPDGLLRARPAPLPLAALALASAALSAALFLLVILLIEGWGQAPAVAALTVTVMPVAAIVAGRWERRHGLVPAAAGCLLVAGGLGALGWLPGATAWWTLLPQVAIGAGLGLALPTLIAATIGDVRAVAGPAAWTVAARHAGIFAGLLLLTPVFTADLDRTRAPAERAGLSHVLDAPLSLKTKIALARRLDAEIESAGGERLPDVGAAFAGLEMRAGEQRAALALRDRLVDELDRAATSAFSRSFRAAALLALFAAAFALAGVLAAAARRARRTQSSNGSVAPRLAVAVPAAATVAALLAAGYVALGGADFGPRAVADPCAPRARPAGIERTQRAALATLDGAACSLGASREDLLRTLLTRRRPAGVSEDELIDAFGDGIDRAQREGALRGFEATALRFGLSVGGFLGVLDLVLGE